MATQSSSLSQSSLTIKDEFEGLEVQEFDANALWELLSDEPVEEAEIGGDGPMQATGTLSGPYPMVESYGVVEGINNDNVQDFDWLHIIMEETYTPCNDMGGWYGGPCMEDMNEILVMGDYSFAHSAIMSDEIGYIGLWQDN